MSLVNSSEGDGEGGGQLLKRVREQPLWRHEQNPHLPPRRRRHLLLNIIVPLLLLLLELVMMSGVVALVLVVVEEVRGVTKTLMQMLMVTMRRIRAKRPPAHTNRTPQQACSPLTQAYAYTTHKARAAEPHPRSGWRRVRR